MPRPRRRTIVKNKMFLHTKNPGHKCDIEWIVEDVFTFTTEKLSKKINLGRGCRTKIDCTIRIIDKEYCTYFIVQFKRQDAHDRTIRMCCDMTILNSKENVYMQSKCDWIFKIAKVTHAFKVKFVKPEYVDRFESLTEDDIENPSDILRNLAAAGLIVRNEDESKLFVLPGESVTIKGSVKVYGCCFSLNQTSMIQDSSPIPDGIVVKTDLVKDLETAFENREFTDVTLKVDGEVYDAHKVILSARSPVFRTILEQNEDEIVIPDMDKYVFELFFRYLYTGIVGPVKWRRLQQLYEASIKYQVSSLRQHCRRLLLSSLSDTRSCEALKFADSQADADLKKTIIDYIVKHFLKIRETDAWRTLVEDNPTLSMNVLRVISSEF